MRTVPIVPAKRLKPIVRVTPHQFLDNYHMLTSPLIDCRVMMLWPPYREWEPPKEPENPTPKSPVGRRPKVLV